jgi:hypothetical protein
VVRTSTTAVTDAPATAIGHGSRPGASRSVVHEGDVVLARWTVLVPVLIVAASAAITVARALGGPYSFWGDKAIEETAVQQAAAFEQTVGPFSYWGFFHPGPSMFYVLSPFYVFTGREPLSLALGALAINSACAFAIVVVARRMLGWWAGVSAAGLVAVHFLVWSGPGIWDHWNPSLIPLPFLLTALLCAAGWNGSWRTVIAAAVTGTFVVQTHFGALPLVCAAWLLGLCGLWIAHRSPGERQAVRKAEDAEAGGRRWSLAFAIAAGALVALMWVPPLVQQLTADSGDRNLSRLVAVARDGPSVSDGEPSDRSLPQAVKAVVHESTRVPLGASAPWTTAPVDLSKSDASVSRWLVWAASLLAAMVSIGWGVISRRLAAVGLGAMTLVVSLVGVVAAMRVPGGLYNYQLWGLAVSLYPGWIGAASAAGALLCRRLARSVAMASAGVALALAIVPAVAFAASLRAPELQPLGGQALASANVAEPFLRGRGSIYASWDPALFDVAEGVVATLRREHIDVHVSPSVEARFGTHLVADGDEQTAVVLLPKRASRSALTQLMPDWTCVGPTEEVSGIRIWILTRQC